MYSTIFEKSDDFFLINNVNDTDDFDTDNFFLIDNVNDTDDTDNDTY